MEMKALDLGWGRCTATVLQPAANRSHESRSDRFRLASAGPLRADATDLVTWADRRPRTAAAGSRSPIGTGFWRSLTRVREDAEEFIEAHKEQIESRAAECDGLVVRFRGT
jgi:hypothetical protein